MQGASINIGIDLQLVSAGWLRSPCGGAA